MNIFALSMFFSLHILYGTINCAQAQTVYRLFMGILWKTKWNNLRLLCKFDETVSVYQTTSFGETIQFFACFFCLLKINIEKLELFRMCCAYIELIIPQKKVHTFASFINSTLLSMNVDPIRPYMDRIRICIAQSNSIAPRSILAKKLFEFISHSEKPQTIRNQCNREKKVEIFMISRFNEPLENWLVDHMATKWLWHDRFLNIHLGLKSKLKSLLLESNLNIDKVTVHYLGLFRWESFSEQINTSHIILLLLFISFVFFVFCCFFFLKFNWNKWYHHHQQQPPNELTSFFSFNQTKKRVFNYTHNSDCFWITDKIFRCMHTPIQC